MLGLGLILRRAGSGWDGSVFASTIVSRPLFLVIFESVTTFGWGQELGGASQKCFGLKTFPSGG